MQDTDKSLDILGVKPVAEAINTVTKASVDGASAFLSRICLPVAEEYGLLLRDRVKAWRAKNAADIIAQAKTQYEKSQNTDDRYAHPRVVGAIVEHGSWCDDSDVQGMWAGLLASACTETGHSQENLIFINFLAQLTTAEARVLNFACEWAKKGRSTTGLIVPMEELVVLLEKVKEISGRDDIYVLDLEIDHLRELGLLWPNAGLDPDHDVARLTPSNISLQLYVRCQGYIGSPLEYFGI